MISNWCWMGILGKNCHSHKISNNHLSFFTQKFINFVPVEYIHVFSLPLTPTQGNFYPYLESLRVIDNLKKAFFWWSGYKLISPCNISSVLDKLFALLKYIILTNIKCHFFRPVIYLQNSLLTPTQGKNYPTYI